MPYAPDPGDVAGWLAFLADREVRHTVIRVITAHLRHGARVSWQGRDFDFTSVIFDARDFFGAVFSGVRVFFGGAEFSGGKVGFYNAKFSGGQVDFGNVNAPSLTGQSHPTSLGRTGRHRV